MTHRAQAETKLRHLAAGGALPASQCGSTFLEFAKPLLEGGVLEWRRSGAGRKLAARNLAALLGYLQQQFPRADVPEDAGSRLLGAARFRNTKAFANTERQIVSLRAFREEALLLNGQPVGAAAATRSHGVFSFLLNFDCPYQLRGSCALVENPAVFGSIEQLGLDIDSVLYGHGRFSNRALDWLAASHHSAFKLLHLPDYDPVGLSEFLRIRSRLGERCALHIPADLEQRFATFSNPDLLKRSNNQDLLAHLRQSDEPEIRSVVALIDRHNAGLEQEALLISSLVGA